MKLTLLGTGGPIPDLTRHGSAIALEIGDARLLFDTGRGVVLQLTRAGIPVETIQPVFITHHHYDHIGDLGDVILTGWLLGRTRALRVVGPPGTASIVAALVDRVYEPDIAFRSQGELGTRLGARRERRRRRRGRPRWRSMESARRARGARARARLPGGLQRRWVCLGYRVEAEGKVVAFSGDSVAREGLVRLARDATWSSVLLHGAGGARHAVFSRLAPGDH